MKCQRRTDVLCVAVFRSVCRAGIYGELGLYVEQGRGEQTDEGGEKQGFKINRKPGTVRRFFHRHSAGSFRAVYLSIYLPFSVSLCLASGLALC